MIDLTYAGVSAIQMANIFVDLQKPFIDMAELFKSYN